MVLWSLVRTGLLLVTLSFAWLVGNAGAPAAWGRPPLATRAVATFNAVLEEAAALEVPSTEICWGGLLEAVQSVYR